MFRAFCLGLRDLADPAILRVFVLSLVVTLALFVALGAGAWFGARWVVMDWLDWGTTAGWLAAVSAFVATILFGWVLFRAIAVAVLWLFGDAIVVAVERRHYPGALASARPIGMAQGLAMGLRSAARALLVNLALAPLYVVLLATGVGTPLLFFAANGWLLGADLGEMVAARHLRGPALRAWRRDTRWTRWDLGTMVAAILSVPFVNLVAPILGAAMATHMFHGRRI